MSLWRGKARLALIVVPMVLLADLGSKTWVEQIVPRGEVVPIGGEWVRLTSGYNTGMAFGLFTGAGQRWVLVAGPLTLAVGLWFGQQLRAASPLAWPFGLLFGGALANLLDRAADGRVTDIVDIGFGSRRWPAFNLADGAITMGLLVLMLMVIRDESFKVASRPT